MLWLAVILVKPSLVAIWQSAWQRIPSTIGMPWTACGKLLNGRCRTASTHSASSEPSDRATMNSNHPWSSVHDCGDMNEDLWRDRDTEILRLEEQKKKEVANERKADQHN